MEIISIEEKAYAQMRMAFEAFVREVEMICGNLESTKIWLDNEDVCRILNISKRQLQHYRDCQRIPFSIIGKKCYYKVTDVEKLISESQIR